MKSKCTVKVLEIFTR